MKRAISTLKLLQTHPHRFRFDAAVRVLLQMHHSTDPAAVVEFRTQPGRAFPAGEVTSLVEASANRKPRMTVAMIGLIGAGGALPRLYETLAGESLRRGSAALHEFLDLLAQRMVVFLGRAGLKYRLHRSAEVAHLGAVRDPVSESVLALTGHGTAGLVERIDAGTDPLLHYAGLFAMRPRSAERLAALISDWLGRPVEILQFAGSWLALPPEQRTRFPGRGAAGAWNTLGGGSAIGIRSWDPHARIVLRIGPLDRAAFEALLPDQPGYRRLASLVQTFLGPETGFAINPVLAGEARFPLRLGGVEPSRLGWNTWTSQPGADSPADAPDALFEVA